MTQSIVLQVCEQCKVHPVEFFGRGRDARLVRCRRIAIKRLKDAGFSAAGISRLIRRDYSTVLYWLKPVYREKRRERYRNYMQQRKLAA